MKVFRNRTSLTYILKLLPFIILIPSISFAAAFVRVNQVGYPANGSKRAYLMASGVETGARFAVKNSGGTTLFSGPIGANLGSWSTSYPDVYALDFSTVTAAGTYTITVSGPIAASSPTFEIDSAANVYSNPLATFRRKNAVSEAALVTCGRNGVVFAVQFRPAQFDHA